MPKRTNAFQAVVYMIKKHIAGDAVVTESAELIDLVSREKREVDVCIEANIAGHVVLIGIECRDHKRPQAVGWVEEMYAKHSRLPTDRLVLVSSSGFTRTALAKAESFGMETVVPRDLTEEQASGIAKRARMAYTRLNLQAETVRAWVTPTETEEEEVVLTLPDNQLFTESGEPFSYMINIVQAIVKGADSKFGELIFDAPEDTREFAVSAEPLNVDIGNPPTPQSLYLEKIDPSPHLRRVDKVEIRGSARIVRSDIPLRRGQLQNAVYSWGKTTFDGKPTVVVITRGVDDTTVVSIRTL